VQIGSGTKEGSSLWWRLYHGETNIEFVRRWKRWATISGIVILIGVGALVGRGLNLGIDFKGGTAWELPRKELTVAKARDIVGPVIGRDVTIQELGNDRIRIKGAKSEAETRDKVSGLLAKGAKVDVKNVDVTFVGPSWGKDVTNKALKALVVFFFVIAAFISVRFEWKMAISAILAVVHDILVTVGVYALSGFEVSPATVIAFLTILGYSLYDTIVVFDKVKENVKHLGGSGRLSYTDIVNLSMNQVLMRSINTSFVAILPILSLLVLGAGVLGATALGDFGLALFIGLLTGAYSSIFVASPLLAILKEREERWSLVRKRLGGRSGVALTADVAAAARSAAGVTTVASDGSNLLKPGADAAFPGAVPRPRKQGKVR
jgi:preprotein translocase subunit SecF